MATDLALLLPGKRRRSRLDTLEVITDRYVVVALTAYNDEESIADAVVDFRNHPLVERVIVVDNNSRDKTADAARAARAIVVTEKQPGYGRCVYRCFQEALAQSDRDLIALCEGDMTFRAKDLDKLIAYIDHANIVNGAHVSSINCAITLRNYRLFMYYGNFCRKIARIKALGRQVRPEPTAERRVLGAVREIHGLRFPQNPN